MSLPLAAMLCLYLCEYVCVIVSVCVAHKNKLHSCHDSHHPLPPVFAIKIRELSSLCWCMCAFGFSSVFMCVSLGSQSVSHCCCCLLLHPTPYTTHHPLMPTFSDQPHPPISLASCHRLGLTGKRKHNQKDNVIMPQCGTIYTKLNTATKKKINISCLSSCHPFLHPPTPLLIFHRFFSAFPYSTHLSFFRLVLLLPIFFYF